jgi:UDP-N-acetylmuramate dehydrogenase
MMAARANDVRLIDRLPPVRGRYAEQVSLAAITWFRVGGPAEVLFRPADQDDLAGFLANKPADVAVTVLGVGSNLLVRDGGVPGVVIRLGRAFAGIQADGEAIEAGAGALDANVALAALEAGIGGLEFLSGVPGTIGGALRMNAGAYGGEIKDVVEKARAVAPDGTIHVLTPDALCLSYRRCGVPKDWIFLSGRLRGHSQPREAIARRMERSEAAGRRRSPCAPEPAAAPSPTPRGPRPGS